MNSHFKPIGHQSLRALSIFILATLTTINHMNAEHIKNEEAEIDKLVEDKYKDPANSNLRPIFDGAIDATLYARAPVRILWILKEPWEERDINGGAGGWSLRALLNEKPEIFSKNTHRYVYCVSFGLLKATRDWAVIRNSQKDADFKTLFRSIAHINVKKLPNRRNAPASNKDVMRGYEMGRDVIRRQIDLYKPDVVFGCSPHMPAIIRDLSGGTARPARTGHATHCRIGDTIFISGYHPAQRIITKEKYVLGMLKAYDAEKQTP
jgi:hypothetical protein